MSEKRPTLWSTSSKVVVAITMLAGIVTLVFGALSELDSRHAPAKETQAIILLVANDLGVVKAERNVESAQRNLETMQYYEAKDPGDAKAGQNVRRAEDLLDQRQTELEKAQDK
jgi:hypothetical protein